jgi:hypothetical protein
VHLSRQHARRYRQFLRALKAEKAA